MVDEKKQQKKKAENEEEPMHYVLGNGYTKYDTTNYWKDLLG